MGDKDVEAGAGHDAQHQMQRPGIPNDHMPSTESSDMEKEATEVKESPVEQNSWKSTLLWSPRWCRWDEKNPPKFGLPLNILFAWAGTFTVANLYYAQPILDTLATHFGVTHEQASQVPTCSQAGYATGIIFICPLGDLVRRRHLILLATFITAALWIGMCLTNSFKVFLALSYLTSVTTVTPQIMLPLVGDLAPPARRATALSIVGSGLVLGLLFARLFSGIIATYSVWRNVYWLSLALQFVIFILLWLFMPDYPQINTDISYPKILWSLVQWFFTCPVLVQATVMAFFLAATFTSFWTTLTFLLSGSPYHYTTVIIGLFSLAGLTPMLLGPIFSRYITDKFVPHVAILISMLILVAGICIGAYTGTFTVAGPILQAALQDFGLQMSQIANRSAVFGAAPKARSRVNTVYMIGAFCGQLMGTAVGNRVYDRSGWIVSGSVSLGFVGAALLVCLARGPAENGWLGWTGGFPFRRLDLKN